MQSIKAEKKGAVVEVTRTLAYDEAAIGPRITALKREIEAYSIQMRFLEGKRNDAQAELDQLLSLVGDQTSLP